MLFKKFTIPLVGDAAISSWGSYSAMTLSCICSICITLLVEKRQVLDIPLSTPLSSWHAGFCTSGTPTAAFVLWFRASCPCHTNENHLFLWCISSMYMVTRIQFFWLRYVNIYSNYLYVYSVPPAHYVIYSVLTTIFYTV